MDSAFYNCISLTTLDFSKFSFNSATNLNYMFKGCTKLASLKSFKIKASNCQSMTEMFYDCQSITTLDFSAFDNNKIDIV